MKLQLSRVDLAICASLALATAAVYAQVADFDFVQADDQTYVTENVEVQGGLRPAGVAWALKTGHASNWHPLTWLSHMLDIELFGMWAGGHHLTNVLLHVLNTLLLFSLLLRGTRQRWPSALVAALFALHPLHVESVAWVSERKDVLSTCLGLLAMRAYVECVTVRRRRMDLVAALFFLSLLAKPMWVTLPFVLLLLDYWPLGRLQLRGLPRVEPLSGAQGRSVAKLVREKLPLFVLAAGSSAMTYAVQQAGGAVKDVVTIPLYLRLANAIVAYVAYLWKAAWPLELGVLYPHPYVDGTGGEPWSAWLIAASATLLIAVTALVLGWLRRPYAIFGWLFYLGTLVPVAGLVQVGNQAYADRYTYVPLVGIFVMLAWGADECVRSLSGRRPWMRQAAALLVALVLGACSWLTFEQVGVWRDSIRLFQHALQVVPENSIIHVAISASYSDQRKMDDAIRHAERAIEIRPDYLEAHSNLGNAWLAKGRPDVAVLHYERALEIEPRSAISLFGRGNALWRVGRVAESIASYEAALEVDANNAKVWNNLGNAQRMNGQLDEAMRSYERAIELDPYTAISYYMLGRSLADQERHAEAISQYERALELDSRHTKARYYLGRSREATR